jgi:hypothetical protein
MTKETNFDFFKTKMPKSRKADFYLGCLDSSVFMDLNKSKDSLISLCRISFDGYGCCNLTEKINNLNIELSKKFLIEIEKDKLDQKEITILVKEIIKINKDQIWTEALKEYNLIDNE